MQNRWFIISAQTFIQLGSAGLLLLGLLMLSSCSNLQTAQSVPQSGVLPVADSAEIPQVISKLLAEADQQYVMGDFNESLATLERAVRIKPRHAEVWSRMAQIYALQGNSRQAIQHAQRSNSYIKNNTPLKDFNDTLIHDLNEGLNETSKVRSVP